MVYKMKWKDAGALSADAEKIGEELKTLGNEITTENIVEKAKDEKTELHKCFEWDDKKAAIIYRKDRAMYIIGHLIIIPETEDNEESPQIIRAYESVTKDDRRFYAPIQKILNNEDWRKEVFAAIQKSIDELIRKLETYENMSGIKHKIFEVKEVLETARELFEA